MVGRPCLSVVSSFLDPCHQPAVKAILDEFVKLSKLQSFIYELQGMLRLRRPLGLGVWTCLGRGMGPGVGG